MLIESCYPTSLRRILQQRLNTFRKVFRARLQQPSDEFVYRADNQTHQEINEDYRDCYVEDCRSKHVIRFANLVRGPDFCITGIIISSGNGDMAWVQAHATAKC